MMAIYLIYLFSVEIFNFFDINFKFVNFLMLQSVNLFFGHLKLLIWSDIFVTSVLENT